ncbi:WD40 repeat-like protein [Imleria badia]|nr:WD40 repeat-like protein [Imleria badia]
MKRVGCKQTLMLSSAGRLRRPEHVRPLRTLTGHTDTVRCVAFFPDNRHIVSSSWDNTVRIWDIETGSQTKAPFTGHTDVVRSVAVSPDGEKIASVAEDRTMRVWSVSSGQLAYEPVEGHASGLWCVTFSPDGRRLATTGDNTIRIWNADTGDLVAGPFRSHNGNLYALTFSPDGLEIASVANDKTVCICDSDIGQMLLGPMEGHDSDVRCVVYTPNGRQLVTAADDGTIRVWDVITGEQLGDPMKSHANIITSIAISPDGTFLATAGPHVVMQVWNLDTRQVAGPPLRHANDVSCVAFSSDARYLVGGCCDFRIWLWDADVVRRPCSDAPPPLPKVEPAPLPTTDSKPEDNTVPRTVSPALIPLPPSPNSLLGSILELPRCHHPPTPPIESVKQAPVQTDPLPATTRWTDPLVLKGLWKRQKKHKRGYPGESSDTSIPGVRGRLQRLVKGLSTKPRSDAPDSDADRHESAAGPAEDIPEAKREHATPQARDDGDEVLFFCCYFARTMRHD